MAYVTQPLELVLTEIVDDGIGHASKGGNGKVWDPRHSSVFAPRCPRDSDERAGNLLVGSGHPRSEALG